ncbi:MAG: IPT/TIG domain-containing protein [Gammaproteobacteria bacterium]
MRWGVAMAALLAGALGMASVARAVQYQIVYVPVTVLVNGKAVVIRRPVVRPAPPPAATISSFAPGTAKHGDTVVVTGTNLNLVTSVSLGTVAATFSATSTQLSLIVPAGAQTAPITVSGTGFSVTSAQSLLVTASPVVTQVSASNVPVNQNFTVSGTGLGQIARFELGTTPLAASNRGDTAVTLQMPGVPGTGLLAYVLNDGTRVVSAYRLTAYVPLAISAFTPAQGAAGGTVTITGAGLDNVTSVRFAGAAAQAVTPASASSLAVTVPADATSGVITLITPFETKATATPFTVLAAVVVQTFNAVTSASGATITITGTGLASVTGATIGGIAAVIASKTDTQLVITAGATAEGEVVLLSPAGNVSAGSYTRTPATVISISHLEFSQMYGKDAAAGTQRLNPSRATLLRAFVLGEQPGVAAPAVTATGRLAGSTLGTVTMTGPATLPTGTQRYDIGASFRAVLPSAWMRPGVSVRVDVTPAGGGTLSLSGTPNVVNPARIRIALVPITIGSRTGLVPSLATVRSMLARAYPYAAGDIGLENHAPMLVPNLTALSDSDWGTVLQQLESLRIAEGARSKLYFGFVPTAARTGGVAGIGYVPRLSQAGSTGIAFSSLGWDSTSNDSPSDPFGVVQQRWAPVMIHELGHNHSRPHAPCGGPASPDPNYPYPDGNFGTDPLWDIQSNRVTGPTYTLGTSTTVRYMKDTMSYCDGSFFSDYNYAFVQQFAEARTMTYPQPDLAGAAIAAEVAGAAGETTAGGHLLLSGEVTAEGVRMNPAVAVGSAASTAPSPSNGDLRIRLRTRRAQQIDVDVDAVEVADLPGNVRHFQLLVPNPGEVQAIEVRERGRLLPRRPLAAQHARAMAQATRRATTSAQALRWTEANGMLSLDWDARTEPFVAVTHVARDGTRRVLGSGLGGGAAELDVGRLPAGGRYEFSLGTDQSARLTEAPR